MDTHRTSTGICHLIVIAEGKVARSIDQQRANSCQKQFQSRGGLSPFCFGVDGLLRHVDLFPQFDQRF